MKANRGDVEAVRASWAVLGGAWGGWVGFRGYLRVPNNADSFGPMIAGGFFVVFALVGILLGAALAARLGRLVEQGLRRTGAAARWALPVATVANAIALWLVAQLVQAWFPGLRG